jgi:hypothetical protein
LVNNLTQKLQGALLGSRRVVGLLEINDVVAYVTDRFDRRAFQRAFER